MRAQTPSSVYSFTGSDPFGRQLRLDRAVETREMRSARLKLDAEAKRKSNEIDKQLRADSEVLKKRKRTDVNLLLLGPRESGKSTVQKQFQILYAKESLESERIAWKQAIHANIAKTVIQMLELIDDEIPDLPTFSAPSASSSHKSVPEELATVIDPFAPVLSSSVATSSLETPTSAPGPKDSIHQLVYLRKRLSRFSRYQQGNVCPESAAFEAKKLDVKGNELFVRSGWQTLFVMMSVKGKENAKHALKRIASKEVLLCSSEDAQELQDKLIDEPAVADDSIQSKKLEDCQDDATTPDDHQLIRLSSLITHLADDIKGLWMHTMVRETLQQRRVTLEHSAGFFLDDIERIGSESYVPMDDDILKARVQTMGVNETTFQVPAGLRQYRTWKLYDVSGARGQRKKSWSPYFSDANAVIFMLSLSCFDEYLEEDPYINRMQDSLQLWRTICRIDELKHLHLIVFLNKADLLKKKLESGVKVSDWVKSYGTTRDNTYKEARRYFEMHVRSIFESARSDRTKKEGPDATRRQLFVHTTTMVDTKDATRVISDVREIIARQMLRDGAKNLNVIAER